MSSDDLEREAIKISYAFVVGSLYTQVCNRLDIAYAVSVLWRFQSNLGMHH